MHAMQDDEPLELATVPGDRIVCGLLYLLTQWSVRGGQAPLALAVGRHLQLLAEHPDTSAPLRASCLRLREHWLAHTARATADAPCGPLH